MAVSSRVYEWLPSARKQEAWATARESGRCVFVLVAEITKTLLEHEAEQPELENANTMRSMAGGGESAT